MGDMRGVRVLCCVVMYVCGCVFVCCMCLYERDEDEGEKLKRHCCSRARESLVVRAAQGGDWAPAWGLVAVDPGAAGHDLGRVLEDLSK